MNNEIEKLRLALQEARTIADQLSRIEANGDDLKLFEVRAAQTGMPQDKGAFIFVQSDTPEFAKAKALDFLETQEDGEWYIMQCIECPNEIIQAVIYMS